jgi:thioredoxin reductase
MAQEYEIIVIGAGPAGLSAALFAARQKASCLLLSKDLGGQLNLIPKLENFPGIMMTNGPLLAKTLESQYLAFGGEMVYDTVERVDESEEGFKIKTTRSEYSAKTIVLAPGKVPNNLGVEGESDFANKGVHYCTKCDGPFYVGRTAAVVGVGGYLLESGILLSRMASKTYLIYKGGALGGDKDLIASIEKKSNVELVPQSSIKSISGNGRLQSLMIMNNSGEEKTIDVDGLFIEMGSKINLDFVKHLIKLNTKGEIEISSGGKTSHPAIFAAGDATSMPYKQIVAASGDGVEAGLSAFNYIERLKGRPGIRSDWKKDFGGMVAHY